MKVYKFFSICLFAMFTCVATYARTLNFQIPGKTEPIKVVLDTVKRTSPSLAIRKNDETDIYYAKLVQASQQKSGNAYVSFNGTVYQIMNNTDSKFFITTTSDTTSFEFKLAAQGTFQIDWGDGNVETIKRTDTTETTYRHTYDVADEYTIGFGGRATWYPAPTHSWSFTQTFTDVATLRFTSNQNIADISGSLGAVFPTIDDKTNGGQPRFYKTFQGCTNLQGSIPAELFSGIYGAPSTFMFSGLFYGCTNLSGTIPQKLFSGISGAPAMEMMAGTFRECPNLTGSIPAELFAGIQGAPVEMLFRCTFCNSGLSGPIPDKLFAGISGAPARSMFESTFKGNKFSGPIPENLFGNIFGSAAESMFQDTFSQNTAEFTGPSAKINGEYLYNKWSSGGTGCYRGQTKLTDYASIPSGWK